MYNVLFIFNIMLRGVHTSDRKTITSMILAKLFQVLIFDMCLINITVNYSKINKTNKLSDSHLNGSDSAIYIKRT